MSKKPRSPYSDDKPFFDPEAPGIRGWIGIVFLIFRVAWEQFAKYVIRPVAGVYNNVTGSLHPRTRNLLMIMVGTILVIIVGAQILIYIGENQEPDEEPAEPTPLAQFDRVLQAPYNLERKDPPNETWTIATEYSINNLINAEINGLSLIVFLEDEDDEVTSETTVTETPEMEGQAEETIPLLEGSREPGMDGDVLQNITVSEMQRCVIQSDLLTEDNKEELLAATADIPAPEETETPVAEPTAEATGEPAAEPEPEQPELNLPCGLPYVPYNTVYGRYFKEEVINVEVETILQPTATPTLEFTLTPSITPTPEPPTPTGVLTETPASQPLAEGATLPPTAPPEPTITPTPGPTVTPTATPIVITETVPRRVVTFADVTITNFQSREAAQEVMVTLLRHGSATGRVSDFAVGGLRSVDYFRFRTDNVFTFVWSRENWVFTMSSYDKEVVEEIMPVFPY